MIHVHSHVPVGVTVPTTLTTGFLVWLTRKHPTARPVLLRRSTGRHLNNNNPEKELRCPTP